MTDPFGDKEDGHRGVHKPRFLVAEPPKKKEEKYFTSKVALRRNS